MNAKLKRIVGITLAFLLLAGQLFGGISET